MVTYPSTHGVFEESIQDICEIVHDNGGQVYMDGANMNAQVGLTSPARSARTSAISICTRRSHSARRRRSGHGPDRGGGAPGAVLPGHPVIKTGGAQAIHALAAAPWASASILLISYGYIEMLGGDGMTDATRGRDPQRELYEIAARAALSGAVHARKRPRGARNDLRFAPVEERERHRRDRRGEAADGLRIPCADGFVSGGRAR